ncbi:ATP12 family chaperone protein [Tropicimonas sp.]|uniref:ATP12 family chaperone protein n=1 Tax=Tropicimonas sp. TaxID=2067044 RepID=UPI003A84ABE4
MSGWKVRRFWISAEAVADRDGWGVRLDGRPVRTPARAPLRLPTRPLAEAIAAEWNAQQGDIDPLSMPLTRSANAAIDKVVPQFAEVAGLIAAYGETDLCCYRAEGPRSLVVLQAQAWDPLLAWIGETHGIRLVRTAGIVPIPQPEASLTALRGLLDRMDAFALTALHDLVALSGSLVIGLAAAAELMPAEELWARSRIDEDWQESQWGADEEATAQALLKRGAFLHASRFHRLSRKPPETPAR